MMVEDTLRAAQEYADAYRSWHGGDYSKQSMLRLRASRAGLLLAFPVANS